MAHKQIKWRSLPPPCGHGSATYCEIIPAGTIPAIDQDGFCLADSEAIAEYFEEIIAHPPMLPDEPQSRARIREISRFHDTRLEPLLRAYFAHISPKTRDHDFVTRNTALLQKRLEQLDQLAKPAPLMFGNQLTIADCGFVATFAIITTLRDVFGFDLVLSGPLQAYERALVAHPSVAAESATYFKALANWVNAKLTG